MGEEHQSKRRRMNPAEASSSSTSQGSTYEVFLSFRGEDTRKGFTDHLYNKLVEAGIHTFRDNEGLRTGEEIGPELLEMIQKSKICIPILSKNYASSKWCLIELTQMMKCKKNMGRIILPIFYGVSPRIVKNQLKSFKTAFLEHDRNVCKVTVKAWKEALKEVGHLKGLERGEISNGHEAELLKKIVAEVLIKLNKISVEIPDKLVGMSHHVEEMRRILDIDSEGVRIVGIQGMGGIGKTTIATFMYEQLAQHYQPYCSFIEDIREEATKHKNLVHLQNRLRRDILKEAFDVGTVSEGKKRIKDELRSKKVLIVLDDVDKQSQLEAVAGDVSWFGSGSRIIVTTRDKAVLNAHEVTWIYEPEEMSQDHSLQLFSLHAFKQNNPPAGFYDIAIDIVSTGAGLPLFMEVIGSLLKGHLGNKPFWESTSKKLKSNPNQNVQDKLKISYDTLDKGQKAIFLDIACHFIGWNRRDCVYMWDGCGFHGENGLGVLVSLSLVKIGQGNKFLMHDLLRDLGRDIVLQASTDNPEKPMSRLWRFEDAEEVLIECKGIENVQTLTFSKPWNSRLKVPGEAFMRLPNLRYLYIRKAILTEGPLPKLRWLSLDWTRISTGSSNWCLEKLVVLKLFWLEDLVDDGLQNLIKTSTNLKVLSIEGCNSLTRTPDFSSSPDLEIIYLVRCRNLVNISPSIKHLNRLTSFSIYDCQRVSELPKDFGPMDALTELYLHWTGVTEISVPKGSMKKLQKLTAENCRSLTQISSIVHLRSLQYLNFEHCVSLSEIPDSIGLLVELQHLTFGSCKFVKLPTSIGSLVKIQHLSFNHCGSLVDLPESMGFLVNLQYLSFEGCVSLVRLPNSIGSLVNLQHVSFRHCESLVRLPNSIGSLVKIQHLSFEECKSLVDLPDSICSLVNLQHLSFDSCRSLVRLPNSIGSLVNLKHLSFLWCDSLTRIPNSIGSLVNLDNLSFDRCESLARLPNSIESLVNLQHLSLIGCKSLTRLPNSIGSLVNLQKLSFYDCKSLARLPNSIGTLVNFKSLSFDGCNSLVDLLDSVCSLVNLQYLSFKGCESLVRFPYSIESLVNLQHLSFKGFKSLVELPDSLCSLVDLRYLSFKGCKSLVKLPSSIGSLVKLHYLSLAFCESLVELPDSLCSLVDLEDLSFEGCKSLVEK